LPADAFCTVAMPLDDLLPQRIANTLVLWRQSENRTEQPVKALTRQRRERLILGLRALDGAAEGHSHRTIARGLFGASRVPPGPAWKSHQLRSRIIRLLTDSRKLRDRGHRQLLSSIPQLRF